MRHSVRQLPQDFPVLGTRRSRTRSACAVRERDTRGGAPRMTLRNVVSRHTGAALLTSALALSLAPALAAAPAPRGFVVLREYGTGTPSRAQPYLEQLLAVVAKQNQWPKVSGRYFAERAA